MLARMTAVAGVLLASFGPCAATDALFEACRLLEQGNYRAAAETLRREAPFERVQTEARFLYATALAGAGEREEAARLFEQLIADDPGRPEPYNNLAALHAAAGELEKAREVLYRGMATSASYAAIHENLSAVYVEMARASYVKALRLKESPAPKLRLLHSVTGAESTRPSQKELSADAEPPILEGP